ncbi:MAG: curli assembly protein CsgF, partial [Henriciella sp.]
MIKKQFSLFAASCGALAMLSSAQASELVFEFSNPSFSGQGASAHWLTIENQEATREASLQDEIEAALRQAEIDERSRP